MHILSLALVAIAAIACGKPAADPTVAAEPNNEPATTETPATTAETTESAAEAPAAPPPSEPAKPEFEPTPASDLKKLSKGDVTSASKQVKAGDAWDTAFAALTKKLGPPTFIANATDSDAPVASTYYWSAMIKGGGCDKLFVQMSADGKSVLGSGMKPVAKDELTYPDKGGSAVDPCTGTPKK
jgi:hypothetical protein